MLQSKTSAGENGGMSYASIFYLPVMLNYYFIKTNNLLRSDNALILTSTKTRLCSNHHVGTHSTVMLLLHCSFRIRFCYSLQSLK
jgi:hypothetical protein